MNARIRCQLACATFLACLATAAAASAQTFTTLVSFDGTNGANPGYMSLVQSTDGNLYGTTQSNTLFRVATDGTLTTLHSFDSLPEGNTPYGTLVQATNGNLYGTTLNSGASGGVRGHGTAYVITLAGGFKTLAVFNGEGDGSHPYAGLVQATNGTFYGVTDSGGANFRFGTVFEMTPGGIVTSLHSFDKTDGQDPHAPLVEGSDGSFYGTASSGGAYGYGTIFKITAKGVFTTLHNFNRTDGANPNGLMQAADGNFYGATPNGGAICPDADCGTVFKMTPAGELTTLYSFNGTDASEPNGVLVQGTDGNLYGTSVYGGNGYGTVFQITTAGAFTPVYHFLYTDGQRPRGGLMQATDGNFYGTTFDGGATGQGTVFRVSVGLGPFVKTINTSGKVGDAIIILGTDLSGATAVTFNGTAAAFTVVSPTEITAAVPAGATTGTVAVVTPTSTLQSNAVFRVNP